MVSSVQSEKNYMEDCIAIQKLGLSLVVSTNNLDVMPGTLKIFDLSHTFFDQIFKSLLTPVPFFC